MNTAAFFDRVREAPFGGRLLQSQVDGLNALLTAWQAHGVASDVAKLAYVLATAYHETADTMQPVAEIGRGAGHDYGKIDATGKAPYGRGYVQLTWRTNYVNADHKLGLGGKLAANYDLALEPAIAAQIIVRGMIEGWFTGKKLADYIHAPVTDYVDARRIVNGIDRAQTIALYASAFAHALNT